MYEDEIPVGRAENLTGKQFGHLTVLYRVKNTKNTATLWKCQCDCGNTHIARADGLKAGTVRHCGCLTKEEQSKRNFQDLTGKRFGKLTVLYRSNKIGERPIWHCKCDCGNECDISASSLRNGTKSCGCLVKEHSRQIGKKYGKQNLIDEVGNVYGELTVIARDQTPPNREGAYWKCKCSCGKEITVWGTSLRNGTKTNCGCKTSELKKINCKAGREKGYIVLHNKYKKEHEANVGKKFNHWTILNIDEDINYAWCECDICKTIKKVNYRSVITGVSKSCCLNHIASFEKGEDLTGQRFGKLTVLYLLDERKNKERVWHCKCDCGNEHDATAHQLKSGNTSSCGCLKSINNAKIERMLNDLNLSYVKEYKPKTLAYKKFDFFVDNKYIIEYDGEQHFKQKGDWDYIATKESDNIKNNWCFTNNIPIIRIPYYKKYIDSDLILETTNFLFTSDNMNNYYLQGQNN